MSREDPAGVSGAVSEASDQSKGANQRINL